MLSVFARDLDAGANGEIVYSLGEGEGRSLLAINTKSGVIQTAAPLDRETQALMRYARLGELQPKSCTVVVNM